MEDGRGYEGAVRGICVDREDQCIDCGGGYLTPHLVELHRNARVYT